MFSPKVNDDLAGTDHVGISDRNQSLAVREGGYSGVCFSITTIREVTARPPDQIGVKSPANPANDPEIGRVIGGRYRLIVPLGTGASATVYLAEDQSLRRQVAVKLLHPGLVGDPKFRKRFQAEAQSAAQMSHPHLMAVHDWGDDEEAYLVTELLPGGSLRQMIDDGYRLSPSQALVVGLHAAEGLAHAHERGFVHRDIKPANLLFGSDGRLRVADFGIARAIAEAAWTEPEGSLIGTARYAPPEQGAGKNVDGRADVYSLALTLIEGVTGLVPLIEPTPLATMLTRQDTDVPRIPELGPLADIVEAAGRVDPDQRPTSAEFIAALNAAAVSLPRPKRLPLVGLQARAEEITDSTSQSSRGATDPMPTANLDPDTGVVDLRDPDSQDPADNLAKPGSAKPGSANDSHWADEVSPGLVDDGGTGWADDGGEEDSLDSVDRQRRWPWLVMVALLAVSAVGIIRYATSEAVDPSPEPIAVVTHPVGTFVGSTVEEAERDISLANWTSVVFERRQDDSVPGEVLEQTPAPGFELEEGLEVTLWVSLGPELRVVPTVTGLPLAEANAALKADDLIIGSVGNAYDEDVPRGAVVSASVEPGTELEFGSRVDIVLSDGPVPREVPSLVGLSPEQATAVLAEAGLVYAQSEEGEFSETVPEGLIISANYQPGELVERDSAVTAVLSRGLPFIQIPDLKGKTGAEAATVLENLGFRVVSIIGSPNKQVIETDPPLGEFHRKGSGITIFARS